MGLPGTNDLGPKTTAIDTEKQELALRLAGGDGPCSGRVEVHFRGDWIPVSDRNFTFPTAQVICAQLGCSKAASVLGGMPFRESGGRVFAEEFWCEGKEPGLWFCPRVPCPGGTCHHSGAVYLVCSEYAEVRLMNDGSSQCEGQVEMSISGRWRTLCASHWSLANAHVVCRQLGCGVALSTPEGAHTRGGADQVWRGQFHCLGAESFLWNCSMTALGAPDCAGGNIASVICSGNQMQVLPLCTHSPSPPAGSEASEEGATRCSDSTQLRLVDGGHRCAGRVEILHQGSWGTICDDGWDLRDAHVVCRQLGCGEALNATVSAHFGEGSGPIWLEELQCTGNESLMWKCPSRGWGRHDCRHKEDAGVICSEFLALRVVSEDQDCAGWLEVFYNGTWGSVCSSPMDATTLSVICRQLGCGASGTLNSFVAAREGSRPRWVDGIQCQKTDTSLWQCPSDPWKDRSCSSGEEASISCADREKLRLRGGDSACSGRVEVWHAGAWGTVCDDYWGLAEAHVVCGQLGCGSALDAPRAAAFGPGNGSIWLDEVRCRGGESSLWECPAAPWGQSDCKHEEDAGVRCSGSRSNSAPGLGIFSLPGVLCITLGALLFLVLVILGIQLHRGRAEHQASPAFEDVIDEALYQEIDNYALPEKEDILDSPGNLSDDSMTKLPYYSGDDEEKGDPGSFPGIEVLPSASTASPPAGSAASEGGTAICSGQGPPGPGQPSSSGLHVAPHLDLTLSADSPQLRLVDGGHHCAGRVEILHQGSWGTICDDYWDLPDAHVVCRQLDCGEALEATVFAHFGEGSGPIWLSDLQCTGTESHVWKCQSQGWGEHICEHTEDAGVICSGMVNSTQIRLVNGGHRCAGRVEILHEGAWGTVCDDGWDLRDAHVVCRQLDCGEALEATVYAHFGQGSGPIWLGVLQCTGTESHVWKCLFPGWGLNSCYHSEDAGVICSGFVRLSGGVGPCSGRVEVHSRGDWTPVSDGNFTSPTAQVICAELGCGKAASVLGGVPFRESDGRVFAEEFWCEGQEPELWLCPRVPCPGGTCHHRGAVHLVCSAYTEVRLMNNGSSQCEGQVEMNISGHWSMLCASHWSLANAHVVCRQLGCGVALSTPEGARSRGGADQVWRGRFHCSGAETFLWNCSVTALGAPDCGPGNTASVICSGNQTQVLPLCTHSLSPPAGSAASEEGTANCSDSTQLRLVNGGHPCAGRVEILHQGSWGTICDDGWDLRDAHVVCRQLSCGEALNATVSAHFGQGAGPIWLEELQCTGNESQVWKCPSPGWGRHDCRHKEDAGVICSEFLALRVVSEDQDCAGWLEVFYNGTWGSVCSSPMDATTLSVICRQLGCGDSGALISSVAVRQGSRPRWVDGIRCRKTDTSLWQCPSDPWKYSSCSSEEEGSIMCADSTQLRLVNGGHPCAGRVEILHEGYWGTICDDGWDLPDAHVVCRQLGCGEAMEAKAKAYFGEGSGPVWLSNLQCIGQESHVWKCWSRGWGQNFCFHSKDAGVICSGLSVRLAGGDGHCSGRVEVYSRGDWIPVSDGNLMSLTAQVICAQLGCGKAVSVLGGVPFRESDGRVFAEEFRCEGQESLLQLCPRVPCPGGTCRHHRAVHLVCSAYTEIRLMNEGSSQCEGQVEMRFSGHWSMLCASHWSLANAHVVCRQLGCGVALSTTKGAHSRGGDIPVWRGRFHCSGLESFLWNCSVTALGTPDCGPGNTASVICSGNQTQVLPLCTHSPSPPAGSTASEEGTASCSDITQLRLVDGGHRCAGRVEILHLGSWGTICDDGWDLRDAHVVCRQLDCGEALNATVSAHFGEGSGPIWLEELQCTGNESLLWKCLSPGWGRHDCRHKEDAGVICSEFLALRVVSEDQDCAGWLEVFYNGTWGSVCNSPMEAVTLSVICRQLGCGDSGTLNSLVAVREGSRPRWVDGIQCRKTDTSLWQCPSDPWKYNSCFSGEEASITCAEKRPNSCPSAAPCTDREKLRLRGGDSACSGRVEVWHAGAWGTVCDDSWGLTEAHVVCGQLGCGSALDAPRAAAFGPGNGSIWLDEVRCRGGESSLWECQAAPWGQSNCKHEEDAGVRCSGEWATLLGAEEGTRTRSDSAPGPGFFSLPGILCIILAALLLLVLVILGNQLHRGRAEHQASLALEDVIDEALYQEIDNYALPEKEDLLDSPGNLSEDSATKLPYYTGDDEEKGDPGSAPEPPGQHVRAMGDGYDDVEEFPVAEIPTSPGMSRNHYFPEEEAGAVYSQPGLSLQSPGGTVISGMGEKRLPLVPRQEDPGYDDVDISTM
ncbi:antigen WC1.1-like [Talpa occidentalis]|uniref:antigen WC1.1-like n=1 Tax=Talpa occidentalis TaxID=50954 RepID=UPI0023F6F849|nr:antigen WC1.1-like [Talpa occidentalis]